MQQASLFCGAVLSGVSDRLLSRKCPDWTAKRGEVAGSRKKSAQEFT